MSLKLTYGGDCNEDIVCKLLADAQFDGWYMRVAWGNQPYMCWDGYGFFDPDTHELRLENEDQEVVYEIDAASIKRIHIY